MQSAAQAYGAVARQAANPRELEVSLLLKAASQLQSVCDDWDRKHADLELALRYNRKLWSVLLASVTGPDHPLPVAIRQNVANLGMFLMSHTMAVMNNPRPEQLNTLVNINRMIAAGLVDRT